MKKPSTLVELFERRFEGDSDKTAYVFLPGDDKPEEVISYGDLGRRARSVARHLAEHTQPGDRVLLLHPSGVSFIEAIYGCILAGRVAVPVGTVKPNRPSNHLTSIRHNSVPAALLADRQYYELLTRNAQIRESLAGLKTIFNGEPLPDADDFETAKVTPDTLAFIQYTSGSTREPRGVMITHGNVMANLNLVHVAFDFGGDLDGCMVGWLPFFHDMGLFGNLLQPVGTAIPSVLMSPMHFLSSPIRWLRAISKYRGTCAGAPNFAYDLCVDRTTAADREGLDLSSWTLAFNGSEPVNPQTLRRFAETFAPYGFREEALYPCYGMAECTLFVAGKQRGTRNHFLPTTRSALSEGVPLEQRDGAPVELAACGSSWEGETLAIVDPETLQEVPAGRVGEIWIAGAHVSAGYWQNPERSAESFGYELSGRPGSFLRTGDLGFVDTEGRLYVTGRRKELIIVRGRNHYPQDIEHTAQTHVPGLVSHRGALFAALESDADARLVLVQEVKRSLPASEYQNVCAKIGEEVLEAHGIAIAEVVLVRLGSIPLTSSGKIQRLKCRAMLAEDKLTVLHRASLDGSPLTRSADATEAEGARALPAPARTRRSILDKLAELVRKHGPRKDAVVDEAGSFAQYGLDSLTTVALMAELGAWIERELDPTLVWTHPSIGALATHLAHPELVSPTSPKLADVCPARREQSLDFSVLFFASEDVKGDGDRYELMVRASRFADQNGFTAVWVPERHFHAFGGLYPSPSVLAGVIAGETSRVRIRSGSVVLPLNNAVRVAEEWSIVDNLSHGRVDLGFAQGWNANDFVLAPDAYEDRKQVMFQGVETIQKLWRGEEVTLPNGRRELVPVRVHPAPLQKELAVWITCSGPEERFVEAGRAGHNILTALLFQPEDELFAKIARYREARAAAGHPGAGRVTLMLHTYVHPDREHVRAVTKRPFLQYLETSTSLWRQEWEKLDGLSETEREKVLEMAYERYARTASLMGTPEFAAETCKRLHEHGVDEIACLVDFGLPVSEVLQSLEQIALLGGLPKTPGVPKAVGSAEVEAAKPEEPKPEPIAIIGVAARVPGAESAESLFENLKRGVDAVTELPESRWPKPSSERSPRAGWLSGVDLFDAEFFRISPHEAALMDPQQRLFLETAWTCIQDAGYSGSELAGARVGVYVGATGAGYEQHLRWNGAEPDGYMLAGNTACTLPARLSYFLDLRGPCLTIDTACSSSLVAIHEACRALRTGECEAAIAGGVSLLLTPDLFEVAGKAAMLSAHGQCRSFDAEADGYVPGEGVGAVFLKPLSAALRDGDAIYGLIRGSSLNHDGRSNGITAPNPKAQIEVARAALEQAGVLPESIGYVECHGTGTQLGDPIEFKALEEIYGGRKDPLPIGSIKTNVGHLLAAAGVASFLKALLSLKSRLLLPSLHFERPNCNLDYGNAALRVQTELELWSSHGPRRAAVSSFGHSGTNASVVLEEFVAEQPLLPAALEVCVVSGRSEAELRVYLERLSAHLYRHRDTPIASIARTLALGRVTYDCRAAFVASSAGELATVIREAVDAGNFVGRHAFAAHEALLRERTDTRARAALEAALTFLDGGSPDWRRSLAPAERAHLPAYPLRRSPHWVKQKALALPALAQPRAAESNVRVAVNTAAATTPVQTTPAVAAPVETERAVSEPNDPHGVERELTAMMAQLLECSAEEVKPTVKFLDVGADSIVLMDVQTRLQARFGLTIPMGDFFETTDTLEKLCERVVQHLRAHPVNAAPIAPGAVQSSETTSRSEAFAAGPPQLQPGADRASERALDTEEQALAEAYCSKTPRSKSLAQEARLVLADNRQSAGFRPATKELVYSLAADRGQGAHVEDQDGNRYLDITMGFGVHLFGHNPPFVREALSKAIERGFVLGPNSPIAGDVAQRIARLTGHERVAFCNSGTEAVMSAIRLARHFTGKSRIALFAHSYHGHSDGVLAAPNGATSVPAVSGVPEGAVGATSVLPYGDERCFDMLDALAGDLAAVLVEPVQARNPGYRPFEFLARLREWTRKRGVLLIFDEMISGFRFAAGGVQELLGFQADLGTYGKIVGGGMPIGVIAGASAILDGVDGGYWRYGDDSRPQAATTFFAGTFSKHPLALEAARAALIHIEAGGKELYSRLNATGDEACQRLNAVLREAGCPGEVRNFGSLFRFFLKGKQDLFFYRLVMNGVYVWEGRNCFLSTEHGSAEVDDLARAVRESVTSGKSTVSVPRPENARFPALDSQRQLWALSKIDPERFSAYNECHALELTGSVDVEALRAAWALIQRRHESLRSVLSEDGTEWVPHPGAPAFSVQDVRDEAEAQALLRDAKRRLFDAERGPLWAVTFLRLPKDGGYMLANFHHLIVDGWSFSVLLEELAAAYNGYHASRSPKLPEVVPFSRFVERQRAWLSSAEGARDAAYWQESLAGYDPGRNDAGSVEGGRVSEHLNESTWLSIKTSARRLGTTTSTLLLAAYLPLLWEWRGREDVVVAVPVSARTFPESSRIVGYCTHPMPLRCRPSRTDAGLGGHLAEIQRSVAAGLSRQNYPFSRILGDYRRTSGAAPERLTALGFNLDRPLAVPAFDGLRVELSDVPTAALDPDLNLTVMEVGAGAKLSLQYRSSVLDEAGAARWLLRYSALLSAMTKADARTPLRELIQTVAGVAAKGPERRVEATFAFE